MSEEQYFLAALDRPDAGSRAEYLDGACGVDTGLRRQVDALLASHFRSGEFLDVPAVEQIHAGSDDADTATMQRDPMASDSNADDHASDELPFLSPPTRPDSLGRIGHYEVLQVLGKGGFGIVFRAFDDALQRVVAVKVMAPQIATLSPARKRFLREARSSAAVRHENVVQVYEVGELPLPYLVMEFIPGETLQQKLDRNGPLEVSEVLRIGRQIAEGLAAAHATDLIHRDIKPGNVLIEGGTQHRVKITDFGLARAADDASISQSGIIAGTPMYMAPEQAKGEKLDQRADLFSLGSVLYQMVAGRPPFRANNMVAVLKRVAEDTPRPIREIIPETPQWLCDIISKLHAKNPDDRYQSARAVADVLADCEAQLKIHPKLKDFTRIPVRVAKPPRKANLKLAFASIAFSFLVLAIWAAPFTIRYAQNHGEIEFNGNVDFEVEKLLVRENGVVIATLDRANPRLKLPPGVYELEAASVDGYEASKFQVNTVRLLSGGGSYERVDGRPVIKLTVERGDSTSIIAIAEKRSERPGKSLVAAFKNGIGMEFVIVPKGRSWLGGGKDKLGDNEVEIPADFYLGKYEVTQEEWQKVMGENPSFFSRTGGGMDAVKDVNDADLKRFPVETVSWDQCQIFVAELNQREKETGWVYRLPTEVEWEYACRGGPMADKAVSAFDFYLAKPTNMLKLEQANINNILKRTCKVGSHEATSIGLYDMHGNVYEWSEDAGRGAEGASLRVIRGGHFYCGSDGCRATDYRTGSPSDRANCLGLRLARVPSGAPSPEPKPPLLVGPFSDANVQRIAALPAAEQAEEVRKELVRLNPKFDGKVEHKIEGGVVTELHILTDEVDNIAPVRALAGLNYLDCRGTYPNKGKLSDLSPLKGMKLSRLDCSSTQIANLSPLTDVPLTILHVNHNPVSDLTPLKGMKLESLGIAETKVTDLSPLRGMKLKVLGAQLLSVTDLSPLEGMPMTGLDLYHTIGVTKLDALKGMPLESLNLQDVPVSDLSPLKGITTLRSLLLQGSKVSDLSPLQGLKLTTLILRDKQISDLSPLKGMPLVRLEIYGSGVSDLKPLQGMPLQEVRLTPKNITQGLDILRDIKSLKTIGIDGNQAWPAAEFWERHDKGEFKE